jgi:hypothetical protein
MRHRYKGIASYSSSWMGNKTLIPEIAIKEKNFIPVSKK